VQVFDATMDEKPFIVFVLGDQPPLLSIAPADLITGPPASGKGTLCKGLAEKNNEFIFHLSMGDHLRHLINGPLKDQPDIVEMVNSGGTKGLVRGDLVISLLTVKIREEMIKGKSAFLVDGCPRNLEQNAAFKNIMKTEFDVSSTSPTNYPRTDYGDSLMDLTSSFTFLVPEKLLDRDTSVGSVVMTASIYST
jgi:hypothetical protein